jgi:hypothetical protein
LRIMNNENLPDISQVHFETYPQKIATVSQIGFSIYLVQEIIYTLITSCTYCAWLGF